MPFEQRDRPLEDAEAGDSRPQPWIGLFFTDVTEVGLHRFHGAKAAVMKALCVAQSAPEFIRRVRTACEDLGLRCVGHEEVGPYEQWAAGRDVPADVVDAAAKARATGDVAFGAFHVSTTDE